MLAALLHTVVLWQVITVLPPGSTGTRLNISAQVQGPALTLLYFDENGLASPVKLSSNLSIITVNGVKYLDVIQSPQNQPSVKVSTNIPLTKINNQTFSFNTTKQSFKELVYYNGLRLNKSVGDYNITQDVTNPLTFILKTYWFLNASDILTVDLVE